MRRLRRRFRDAAFSADVHAGMLGARDKTLDHAVMVPLYFIEKYYTDYQLVRVSVSGLPLQDHYRFGQCVAQAAEELERRTVFIASGDLSHRLAEDGPYGFNAQGPGIRQSDYADDARCGFPCDDADGHGACRIRRGMRPAPDRRDGRARWTAGRSIRLSGRMRGRLASGMRCADTAWPERTRTAVF